MQYLLCAGTRSRDGNQRACSGGGGRKDRSRKDRKQPQRNRAASGKATPPATPAMVTAPSPAKIKTVSLRDSCLNVSG